MLIKKLLFVTLTIFHLFSFSENKNNKKLNWKHSIETGAMFRVGKEHTWSTNTFNNTTYHTNTYIIGSQTQFFSIRISNYVQLKPIAVGVAYGADIFIQRTYANTLLPILATIKWHPSFHHTINPIIIQRVGYSFYLHNYKNESIIRKDGIDGGVSDETLTGFSLQGKKQNKVQHSF